MRSKQTDALLTVISELRAEVERLEIALDKEIERHIRAEATLRGEIERLKQTLNAVIEYTELSEQDFEQAKFEAGCD